MNRAALVAAAVLLSACAPDECRNCARKIERTRCDVAYTTDGCDAGHYCGPSRLCEVTQCDQNQPCDIATCGTSTLTANPSAIRSPGLTTT